MATNNKIFGFEAFQAPQKNESGVWQSTTLHRLRAEARAALTADPVSWLALLGYLTLLNVMYESFINTKTNEKFGEDEGPLFVLYFALRRSFSLPANYLLDANDTDPAFKCVVGDAFGVAGVRTQINIPAVARLVEGECDRLSNSGTEYVLRNDVKVALKAE